MTTVSGSDTRLSMRNSTSVSAQEAALEDQALALNRMTQDLVRKSTVNGAVIGAIAGCGLTVLAASNAKSCVGGLVAGGAIGGAIGHAKGKQEVAKRAQLVSPSAVVRSIGKAKDETRSMTSQLTVTLAEQDKELTQLNTNLQGGQITEAQFATRFEEIRSNRAEVAEALSLSAAQARNAHRNLKVAEEQGQTGLDWHLNATQHLENEVMSARSMISLL